MMRNRLLLCSVFSLFPARVKTKELFIIRRSVSRLLIDWRALYACPRRHRAGPGASGGQSQRKQTPTPCLRSNKGLANSYEVAVSRQTAGTACRHPLVHPPHAFFFCYSYVEASEQRPAGLRLHHRQRQYPHLFSSRKNPLQQQMNTRCDILPPTAQG